MVSHMEAVVAPIFCSCVKVLIGSAVKLAVFEDALAYRSGGACAEDRQLYILNSEVMLTSRCQQKSHSRRARSTQDPVSGQIHVYILFDTSLDTYNVELLRAGGALCLCHGHSCKDLRVEPLNREPSGWEDAFIMCSRGGAGGQTSGVVWPGSSHVLGPTPAKDGGGQGS